MHAYTPQTDNTAVHSLARGAGEFQWAGLALAPPLHGKKVDYLNLQKLRHSLPNCSSIAGRELIFFAKRYLFGYLKNCRAKALKTFFTAAYHPTNILSSLCEFFAHIRTCFVAVSYFKIFLFILCVSYLFRSCFVACKFCALMKNSVKSIGNITDLYTDLEFIIHLTTFLDWSQPSKTGLVNINTCTNAKWGWMKITRVKKFKLLWLAQMQNEVCSNYTGEKIKQV